MRDAMLNGAPMMGAVGGQAGEGFAPGVISVKAEVTMFFEAQ